MDKKQFVLILLVAGLLVTPSAFALSVDDAYLSFLNDFFNKLVGSIGSISGYATAIVCCTPSAESCADAATCISGTNCPSGYKSCSCSYCSGTACACSTTTTSSTSTTSTTSTTTTTSSTTTTTIAPSGCTNHAQCSQACTTLCPSNVYGCCYGCLLGQCVSGTCQCTNQVSYCSSNPPYQKGSSCSVTTTTVSTTTTTTTVPTTTTSSSTTTPKCWLQREGYWVNVGSCEGIYICSGGSWIDHCSDGSCNCGETTNSCSQDCKCTNNADCCGDLGAGGSAGTYVNCTKDKVCRDCVAQDMVDYNYVNCYFCVGEITTTTTSSTSSTSTSSTTTSSTSTSSTITSASTTSTSTTSKKSSSTSSTSPSTSTTTTTIVSLFPNQKDLTKYSSKQVFLISDKNWRDVLSLVPATVWTNKDGSVNKYPLLIYHDEDNILAFVSIGDVTGAAFNILDGGWQSFVAEDDFISKVKVGGGAPGQTYYLQLQDSKGNVIANSESVTNLQWYEVNYFTFNVNVNKGESYKLVWRTTDKNSIYVFYSENNPYQDGQYSEDSNYDLEMEIYGDNPTRVFDADSIIYFMQQYQPDRVIIVGDTPQDLDNLLITAPELGAGLNSNQISRISTTDYLKYWSSVDTIVVVDYDNYQSALMASTFASYINAPIIFINSSNLDSYKDLINNRTVYIIDNLDSSVNNYINSNAKETITYTLSDLQKEYIKLTNTDKIILVNPNDLNIKVSESFTPEKSTNSISELYSKTSLAAPILAAGKYELILSIISTDYQQIDSFIENEISNFEVNVKYLTIMAGPDAIQMSKVFQKIDSTEYMEEVDNHIYGNIDKDDFQELAVGRIFSLTISDVSSYISRDLFVEKLIRPKNFIIFHGVVTEPASFSLVDSMTKIGYIEHNYEKPKDFEDVSFIFYSGHGSFTGWWHEPDQKNGVFNSITSSDLSQNNIWLSPVVIIPNACSNCDYDSAKKYGYSSNLFCINFIRRGALAFYGAINPAGLNAFYPEIIMEWIFDGNDIGTSFMLAKNQIMMTRQVTPYISPDYDEWYVMIGDPTLNLHIDRPNENRLHTDIEKIDDKNYMITLTIPSRTMNVKAYDYLQKLNFYLFGWPKGSIITWGTKGVAKNETTNEIKYYNDWEEYSWYIDVPNNLKIKGITKIVYETSSQEKVIDKMPVFSKPNFATFDPLVFGEDREGDVNRLWFGLIEVLGGDPPILNESSILSEYKYKIYLNMEGV